MSIMIATKQKLGRGRSRLCRRSPQSFLGGGGARNLETQSATRSLHRLWRRVEMRAAERVAVPVHLVERDDGSAGPPSSVVRPPTSKSHGPRDAMPAALRRGARKGRRRRQQVTPHRHDPPGCQQRRGAHPCRRAAPTFVSAHSSHTFRLSFAAAASFPNSWDTNSSSAAHTMMEPRVSPSPICKCSSISGDAQLA